jgi:hypothetical protein
MWLLISRKFALICMICGLAFLCSGCMKSMASSAPAAKTPVSDKKATPGQALPVRLNTRPTAMPSRTSHPSNIAPIATQFTTTTASSPSHQPLSLFLACSKPTASDGFSVTNTHARACVYTTPGATLIISVHFCNGKADPSEILRKNAIADASGFYEWNWTPIADCNAGHIWEWHVKVTVQMQESSTSVSEASSASSSIATSSSSSSFSSP